MSERRGRRREEEVKSEMHALTHFDFAYNVCRSWF